MKIKIIFDTYALDKKFSTGWGVSFLVNDKILFDTGENGKRLINNMKKLKVNADKLETVVISHDHWDHRGGLWDILKKNPKLKVYFCPNFSRIFKKRIKSCKGKPVEMGKFMSLSRGIYTTGEIDGIYAGKQMPEQALVIKTRKGITVLTGCAHPGAVKIIEKVKQNISGNIYLVLGGFHLMGRHKKTIQSIVDRFKQLKIKKVAPTHCSGKNAMRLFKKRYGSNFIEVKVGETVEV